MKNRPSWHDYFIGLAYYASTRSNDSQTKVGCVIVGADNRVISIGYNGFCSGVDTSSLPTTRPMKYPFIVHAEENAISHMLIKPSFNKVAYITHVPCHRCAKLMWQNEVREWYIPINKKAHSHSEDDEIVYNHLQDSGLVIHYIEPNLDHFEQIYKNGKQQSNS